jgi:hypothetical protein
MVMVWFEIDIVYGFDYYWFGVGIGYGHGLAQN